MLRRNPTAIELTLDDIQEYEDMMRRAGRHKTQPGRSTSSSPESFTSAATIPIDTPHPPFPWEKENAHAQSPPGAATPEDTSTSHSSISTPSPSTIDEARTISPTDNLNIDSDSIPMLDDPPRNMISTADNPAVDMNLINSPNEANLERATLHTPSDEVDLERATLDRATLHTPSDEVDLERATLDNTSNIMDVDL